MRSYCPGITARIAAGTLALAVAGAPAAASAPATTEIDRIVAIVDDDVVTDSELREQLANIKQQLRQQQIALPAEATLRKQVLERLVVNRIQLQLAASSGIRVDDETLNQTISAIAAQNKLSLSEFRNVLQADGFDFAKFRENIRDEITVTRLRQRQVDSRIMVSDQEIDNFLENEKRQGNVADEYRIGHILIALPEAATPEQIQHARQKAERVLELLRGGADFGQTAIAESDGQQALSGGDLGWRKAGELPTLFAEAVLELKAGEIGDLIRSPSGFHIIKLVDHRGAQRHIVAQTRARHILIKPDELVSDDDARNRLLDLRRRIAEGEGFENLAREYSDDKASAAEGGDLGWVGPEDMVPEFGAALDRLAAGEVSEPVKTRFGWHLIQALERRDQDDTESYTRAKAREVIYQRKAEEEHLNWLRRLRDEAYVEYRLGE